MAVVSTVVLILAFSIIYFIIQSAYSTASKSRLQESLSAQLYSLMAIADEQNGQLFLPELLRNDKLNHLNSGVIAYVLDSKGELIWRSQSSGLFSKLPDVLQNYSLTQLSVSKLDETNIFWLGDMIIWEHENATEARYLFLVGEKENLLTASIQKFKQEIMFWLSITAIVLIIVLVFSLNISLLPLKEAQSKIELVSNGDAERIEGRFPTELLPLTSSINLLLENESRQKIRYRDALGNLAHSLKTPLAVIKSELQKSTRQKSDSQENQQLYKQIESINGIIRYQLNRSVVTAGQTMRRKTPIAPELKKIIDALKKVYVEKNLNLDYQVSEACIFPGEQGDLMELVGNLADNACKWANSKVLISVTENQEKLVIVVEDDGDGIPEKQRELILDRGKRLDQKTEGQGLGLSIVMDIIKTYQAELSIDESEFGGAKFIVTMFV